MNISSDRQRWPSFLAFSPSSAFSLLLSQPETSIEKVLSSPDCIPAARSGLPALLTLYVLPSLQGLRLEDLLEYVVDEPLDYITPRQQALFPFIATEMLLEAPELQALVTESEQCLEKLFSCLKREELSPTSAAYFSAVAQGLLGRNAAAVAQFLFLSNDYKGNLVRCMDCRAVGDFLWKLICCEPGFSQFPYIKICLLQSLSDSLSSQISDIAVSNIGRILQDLLNSRDLKGWKVFVAVVIQTAGKWCETLKYTQNPVLISTLLRLLASLLSQPDIANLSQIDLSDVQLVLQRLALPCAVSASPFLPCLFSTFPQLCSYLKSPTTPGLHCSLILDLMCGLVGWDKDAEEMLVSEGLIDAAVSLFATQLWSSLVHKSFERLVQTIGDTGFLPLQSYLIRSAKLPWTLASIASDPYQESGKHKVRKGNLGHVSRIGNYLKDCWGLKAGLSEVEQFPWWRDFVQDFLEGQNRLETGRLGEGLERSPSALFSEQLTTALQQSSLAESLQDCEEDTAAQFHPVEYWKIPVEQLDDLEDLE